MSLQETLNSIRDAGAKRIPAELRKIMHDATDALRASGAEERAIAAGAALPPFELSNHRGELVKSADLLARGPLVLTLYRGAW